jgi:predicted aldo/keto reductase-like oxidoreductase
MGFIAMKPFGGGLLKDARLSIKYLFQPQFEGIVPDPGIEKLAEMEEIAGIVNSGEKFTEADAAEIEKIREEFKGSWCHCCDYCQPCPQKINLSTVLNVERFIIRMPYAKVCAMAAQPMELSRGCTGCRACAGRCPYGLDIPGLIKEKLVVWDKYLSENS